MSTDRPAGSGGGEDPLAPLAVIDRLEVGPVAIRADRLTMPYRVFQGGQESVTEQIYARRH